MQIIPKHSTGIMQSRLASSLSTEISNKIVTDANLTYLFYDYLYFLIRNAILFMLDVKRMFTDARGQQLRNIFDTQSQPQPQLDDYVLCLFNLFRNMELTDYFYVHATIGKPAR